MSEDWRYEVLKSEYLYYIYPVEKLRRFKIGATDEERSCPLEEIRSRLKSYKNKPVIMKDWETGKYMHKKEVLRILDERISEEE